MSKCIGQRFIADVFYRGQYSYYFIVVLTGEKKTVKLFFPRIILKTGHFVQPAWRPCSVPQNAISSFKWTRNNIRIIDQTHLFGG